MKYSPINLQEKLTKFADNWSPKIIAQMNDYHFKLVKLQGDFVWHSHDSTDEVFLTLDGEMFIEFRDAKVKLKAGEMFVVPKGVEHKPFAESECKIMLIEPAGTINTGDAGGELTAEENVWILRHRAPLSPVIVFSSKGGNIWITVLKGSFLQWQ